MSFFRSLQHDVIRETLAVNIYMFLWLTIKIIFMNFSYVLQGMLNHIRKTVCITCDKNMSTLHNITKLYKESKFI